MRRISAVYDGYSVDGAVDLFEELDLCDAGDIFVIPGNIEKTFDQVSKAVSHVFTSGAFPILCGGDHSLGYPNVRGIAPHIDGNVGIIHIDPAYRHAGYGHGRAHAHNSLVLDNQCP